MAAKNQTSGTRPVFWFIVAAAFVAGIWYLFDQSGGGVVSPQIPATNKPAPARLTLVTNHFTNTVVSPSIPRTNAPTIQTSLPPALAVQVRPDATNDLPPANPGSFPRPSRDVLEAQIALDRQAISPGSIDGVMGSQTRGALSAYQTREKLPASGELDEATRSRLLLRSPAIITYEISAADVGRLQPLSATWMGKSQQGRLEFAEVLELISERTHAHPSLIRRLNPGIVWTNVSQGATVKVPATTRVIARERAAAIRISLEAKTLRVVDSDGRLIAHFPCSIAARVDKRPEGELKITTIAGDPNYTFDPKIFPESAEARKLNQKLVLPPGPNSPVGTAWIGLDRPGYGIHGTPQPEMVGRTESHGCFRLANWNVDYLEKLVWIGMPVRVEP